MKLLPLIIGTLYLFIAVTAFLQIVTYHNSHHNCIEAEKLKTRVRQRTISDYNHLTSNARLFGIKLTPALKAAEKNAEQRILKDYARSRCAGIFG